MKMFCWGNSTHHELCIQSSETLDLVIRPTLSKWKESENIKHVDAGEFHSLYLTNNGQLYSCGSNEVGQLGRETESGNGRIPGLIETFKDCTITSFACGIQHSIAIDEWGQSFSWGSDNMGQLGNNLGAQAQSKPKFVKVLATKNVIQVACGAFHSMALTNSGDLFAWGANGYGQCGLGTVTNREMVPQLITSLAGIPIALIACGSYHTFVLSKSGAVFGWGKNSHGQLGLQDRENKCYPAQLKSLRNVKVCYIACGEDFTAFLTLDGGVFTCGIGEYGQTGHGTTKDELVPRKVLELMGSTVTQIACGRRHMLCRVGERILACGYGARGQLGCPHMSFTLVPTCVQFIPSDESPVLQELFRRPLKVFAGGDHSFLVLTSEQYGPIDFRTPDHTKQILTLTIPKLAACGVFKDSDVVNQDLLAYLETAFGSLACVNGSFLLANNAHFCCNTKMPGVDLKRTEEAFTLVSRFENSSIKELIFNHLTENIIKMKNSPPDAEALRIFLILPLYHEMRNPRRHPELQGPFAEAYNNLSTYAKRIVNLWWEKQSTEYFEMLVDIFKSVIVYELMQPIVRANKKLIFTHSIIQILNTLAVLSKINFSNPKTPKIPAECFYIEDLSNHVDIATDYMEWLSDHSAYHPHMCNYAFLFDVQCKSLLLKIDQHLQMHYAVTRANAQLLTRFFIDSTYEYEREQFLNLTVSRSTIVSDTMVQISNNDTSQLKKPLRVQFVGEEAEDAGGVKKEFFMLLLKEIFNPIYGMFIQSPETNMIWFSSNPYEDDLMYKLIGSIYGLAIYNSIIIYVPFPLALYKKLLGEAVMLDDLSDLSPTIANSLKNLLEYPDEDVEEVFDLCFAVNTEVFDQIQVHPLKENGINIPVTHDNKKEYVELYVDFLLNKSVENQFKAFDLGFQKVCGGRIIKLFRSHELMSVVIGNEDYNWELFESNCEYRNGYSATDPQIRWFWETFHELAIEDKKKFLLFLTGSDRVPIQGMKDIKIRIQAVADDRFFPVAHTCFNLLDLPRYKTKERLKYYLLQAIQQTQGFSLV